MTKLTPQARTELLVRAAQHANEGLAPGAEVFVCTGGVQVTSSGIAVVSVRQEHVGIPVHNGIRMVRFDAAGAFDRVTGGVLAVPDGAIVAPKFSAADAVHAVLIALLERDWLPSDLSFSSERAEVVAEFPSPARPTVLRKPPFEDPITASLLIDGESKKSPLAWEVRLALPDAGRGYVAHVSAAAGALPAVRMLEPTSSHAARGLVFELDPRLPRVDKPFPPPRAMYPTFGGGAIPHAGWVEGGETVGNNTVSRDRHKKTARATLAGGDLVFEAADPTSIEQGVVNAFYTCNYLHDFFLLLGFDEAAGNFQKMNDPGVGAGGDALEVIVRDEFLDGWAFYDHKADGKSPKLELGRHVSGNHTSLDAHIVMHEFVHGVLDRVIGTKDVPSPLDRHQESSALGEGFCDYFAVTITNMLRRQDNHPEEWEYAGWLSGSEEALRPHSYNGYPKTYGYLTEDKMKTHKAGQVWCAALLELNKLIGDELAWRTVFDSLMLVHPGKAGPTFVHARDAVFSSFDALAATEAALADPATKRGVRKIFSDRGLGKDAQSPKAKFRKVVESFTPFR